MLGPLSSRHVNEMNFGIGVKNGRLTESNCVQSLVRFTPNSWRAFLLLRARPSSLPRPLSFHRTGRRERSETLRRRTLGGKELTQCLRCNAGDLFWEKMAGIQCMPTHLIGACAPQLKGSPFTRIPGAHGSKGAPQR